MEQYKKSMPDEQIVEQALRNQVAKMPVHIVRTSARKRIVSRIETLPAFKRLSKRIGDVPALHMLDQWFETTHLATDTDDLRPTDRTIFK